MIAPPGGGRAHRVEQGGFNKNCLGFRRAARGLAADDPAHGQRPAVIGDNRYLVIQFVFLAVQCQNFFSRFGQPHVQSAINFVGVEHVQRSAKGKGHIVGDVHQRRNGAQSDGLQTFLQPRRTGAVFHTTHGAANEIRARFWAVVVFFKPQFNGHGAWECSGDCLDAMVFECAQTTRGQIPGDAMHPQTILTIGSDGDVDHRIVHA